MENHFCLQVPTTLHSEPHGSGLSKCLWELDSPGVPLLFEQNPQNQKENARNPFLKQPRTRKTRSLRRRRKRRKRTSPREPPPGLPPDQRLRGNKAKQSFQRPSPLPHQEWLACAGLPSVTHSCRGVSCSLPSVSADRSCSPPSGISVLLEEPGFHFRP